MKDDNKKQPPLDAEQDEQLRRLVQEALEKDGTIIPTTPEAVARVEAELESEDFELPPSLRTFGGALQRASEQRLICCTPLPMPAGTEENLARAAREGGEVPHEVEAQMRADRAAAEGRVDGEKQH